MRKFVIVLALIMVIGYGHAQKFTVGLNLEEGVAYKQNTKTKATIKQEISGQSIDLNMTIAAAMTYLVTGINGYDYDMEVTYQSMTMAMDLPQGTMEFSSMNPSEEDILSLVLSGMTNKTFQLTMTKYGRVKSVTGLDKLFESAFSGFANLTEEQLEQLKTQVLKAYGEEAFIGSIEMATAIYPRGKVKIGDNWVVRTKLTSGMAADVTTTYQLADRTKEHYLLTGRSKILSLDMDEYVESNGMQVKVLMDGTMASEIKIDRVSGWIVDAKILQEMSGKNVIKENPQLPEGLIIPMEMENEIIFAGY